MNLEELIIDEAEVLRYLGYKGQVLDENIQRLVNECREEIKKIIAPKVYYKYFNLDIKEKSVLVDKSLNIVSKDIMEHLKSCDRCVFLGMTLGSNIEKTIRLYEKRNLTKALIMDACATTVVEEICDSVENEIGSNEKKLGNYITFRFSPGYGDFPIAFQSDFLNAIDGYKNLGLTCSEHNILIPRKSVTAIIGISKTRISGKRKSCLTCIKYNDCTFRREGEACGS